jgi:hypothetical protein
LKFWTSDGFNTEEKEHHLVYINDDVTRIRQTHGHARGVGLPEEGHPLRLTVRFTGLQVQVDVFVEIVGEGALELVDGEETEGVEQPAERSPAVVERFVPLRRHCLPYHGHQTQQRKQLPHSLTHARHLQLPQVLHFGDQTTRASSSLIFPTNPTLLQDFRTQKLQYHKQRCNL